MPRSPKRSQWFNTVQKCNGHCWYCGTKPDNLMDLTVDHATPQSREGSNREDNLLPACLRCNQMKDNMTVHEFRKYVKVKVIRRLLELGYAVNLTSLRIVFYGEGNLSPISY